MNAVHISMFIVAFMVAKALIDWLPDIISAYRERALERDVRTSRELTRFFLKITPVQIIGIFAVLGLAFAVLTGEWIVGVLIGLAGVVAPRIILNIWKSIRSTRFDAELMDALILLGNSLKSGLDIAAGIERVALASKPPISEEFGLAINSYRLGTPIELALLDITTRIRSRTFETAVYAIIIQRETGGNIIKTFDQLINTIREEGKLQKKVSAITSQGRTQILVLSIFPWVLGLLMLLVAPEMVRPALQSTYGPIVIVGLLAWESIGMLVAKRIVAVEV